MAKSINHGTRHDDRVLLGRGCSNGTTSPPSGAAGVIALGEIERATQWGGGYSTWWFTVPLDTETAFSLYRFMAHCGRKIGGIFGICWYNKSQIRGEQLLGKKTLQQLPDLFTNLPSPNSCYWNHTRTDVCISSVRPIARYRTKEHSKN